MLGQRLLLHERFLQGLFATRYSRISGNNSTQACKVLMTRELKSCSERGMGYMPHILQGIPNQFQL